jgi:outer membrane protein OmpA-like peptidoglycan-associated protein
MANEPSQCWRAIAIGVGLWFALAALTLLRGPEAPGSLAALNWQTENKATQALKNAGLTWAQVRVRDGVLTLSGAAPNREAAGAALAAVRAATTAQYGFPGVYHTFTTAFPTPPPASPAAPIAAPSSAAAPVTSGPAVSTPLSSAGQCEQEFQTAFAGRQIQFAPGSAILPKSARPLLVAITDVARRCQAFKIVIGGHTDATGDARWNQTLSEQRAASVLNYLAAHGAQRAQLSSIGYGASRPLSTERTFAAHRQNRRITFDVSCPP